MVKATQKINSLLQFFSLEICKDLAENIENEIFSLYNSDSNKHYRDKVNAIKMKLKVISFLLNVNNNTFFKRARETPVLEMLY